MSSVCQTTPKWLIDRIECYPDYQEKKLQFLLAKDAKDQEKMEKIAEELRKLIAPQADKGAVIGDWVIKIFAETKRKKQKALIWILYQVSVWLTPKCEVNSVLNIKT